MGKYFKHYGVDVVYLDMIDFFYKDILKNEDIPYVELPLLDYTVLAYKTPAQKYAVIVESDDLDCCLEHVYITTEIPLDMNWKNLVNDIDFQMRGEKPMELLTKAKVICNAAEEICRKHIAEHMDANDIWRMGDFNFDANDFRMALMCLGYNLSEIMEMDHHDVDEEFLREMGSCARSE